jgi:hypothetical protein
MFMLKDRGTLSAALKIISTPPLWKSAVHCLSSISGNFFFLQYRGAALWKTRSKKRIPVSKVDHPSDNAVPFSPERIAVYLDFSPFWIRTAAWLLDEARNNTAHRNAMVMEARDFIDSIARLYEFAAVVYRQNLSTTSRPRYLKSIRFIIVHLFDPHLMCIPSLHVMLMIFMYTRARKIMRTFNLEEKYTAELEKIRAHSTEITDAVLYVKQHSINCVSAAMYAMTRFDASLFPYDEALKFCSSLFRIAPLVSGEVCEKMRSHICALYKAFYEAGENLPGTAWDKPLLDFLAATRAAETGK